MPVLAMPVLAEACRALFFLQLLPEHCIIRKPEAHDLCRWDSPGGQPKQISRFLKKP